MIFRSLILLVFLMGAVIVPMSGCSGRPTEIEVPDADSVPVSPDKPSGGQLKGEPVKIPKS